MLERRDTVKILNKMNLSKKINVLIIIYTVIVILSYTTLSLNTSGKKAMETAGVELAGCASITSGTIDEKLQPTFDAGHLIYSQQDYAPIIETIKTKTTNESIILVKGSRGMKLETIINEIELA